MTPGLIVWSFLLSFVITPLPVFTANFTEIRVPLSITPVKDIPRPDFKDAEIARYLDLYSKATIYDDLTLSRIYDLDRILSSTMSSVISNIFVLEERGRLNIDNLTAYICTTWCYNLSISEITRVTGKTMENLKGSPDTITVLEMHNAIVETLEDIFCFNMTKIEETVGMSSKILLEHQWALFVPEIVKEGVKCRADILGVTVSELAELLRTDTVTLYGYTLHDLSNIFFPNFLSLQARKTLFETRSLNLAYASAGLTQAQGNAETMLTYAGHSSIAFNRRDLEILYDWQKPQLFAIEHVPLSSYFAQCSVDTSNSLLAVSTVLFGQGTTEPTCNVAYVLSRSLNDVEVKFPALTTVENRNSLYIFMTATEISSWFIMDNILQLDIDEAIWVEIPSVGEVASAANRTIALIKSCSLPEVIVSLMNSNATGTLTPFLAINNPSFRSLLLSTYGYTTAELISLTENAQILNLSVVELHALILDALVERYSISDLHVLVGEPGIDMRVLSTLPSFEWSRIVRAVVEGSFAHAADAVSVNVVAAGSHLVVTDQADGNPSIQISPTSVFFSPNVTASTLATCLLGRNEADIYNLPLSDYHQLFSGNIVSIVRGKITIETSPLEALLANDNLVLRNVWNRTVADVIAEYTDLTVQQLGCLYGWNQEFLGLINQITWGNVSAYRLCNDYETLPLHQILVLLLTAQPKNCFGTISLTSSNYSVGESDGFVIVSVQLVGGEVDDDVHVRLSLSPLTASAGTDFESRTNVNVTFEARETGTKPVVINIPDDGIVENDEQFLVLIQSLDSDTRVVISSAIVTINDDDFVSISWQVNNLVVNESVDIATANLVLNGQIEKDVTLSVGAKDGTTSAADYSLLTTSVTFTPSDVSNKPVRIVIEDDDIVEGTESVGLELSTADAAVNTTDTLILIQDDDKIIVSFVQSKYSFNEGIREHQLEVTAVALQLTTNVQISLHTSNNEASAGEDYTNSNVRLTFSPFTGNQTSSFTVEIFSDDFIEDNETFSLQLQVPTISAALASLGTPFETVVTIVDDDSALINFESASYSVDEGDTSVYVNVTLTGDLRRPVAVGYFSQANTASTNDFTVATETITFNPLESAEKSIRILITQDDFVESSEQFDVRLLLRDEKGQIGSIDRTTVTIIDDDKAEVQHVETSYTFPENVSTALLGVRLLNLAGALQTNVNVRVLTVGSTATPSSDFTAPSSVLTFYAGDFDQIRNISLPIIDDNLFEMDETLQAVLSSGPDKKIEVASPPSAEVTITSNDVALISFTSSSFNVTEGQSATVSLEVTAGTLGSPVTVRVTSAPATAVDSDFARTTRSVTFQAGEAGPKTVNFATTVDDIVESTELFTVSLSTTSGVSLGSPANVSISDNDATPPIPKDDLLWLVYPIVFGVAFLIICMFILFVCCVEYSDENRYMVEKTTLVTDRNKYFFLHESLGIVNPNIEMSPRNDAQDTYTTSHVKSRMESNKVNPMFHETKSHGEQSSVEGKSSISTGQDGYVAL